MTENQPACATRLRTPAEITAAVRDARTEPDRLHVLLDQLSAPVYMTDAQGWVTYFNRACVDFAGRTPSRQDRWCVTWRLYTEDGTFLPHERCPMALALKERREVRGVVAIAERPDGTRVLFAPYPTPLHDESGELTGALNVLIDLTYEHEAHVLRAEARRCRRLAQSVTDARTIEALTLMADEYEEQARTLGAGDRIA